MSAGWFVGLLIVGLGLIAVAAWGLAGMPSLKAPDEPTVVAWRAWIAATGPAVALLAAIIAGAIALQNLQVSKEALRAADRPWVGIETLTLGVDVVAGSSLKTIIVVRNSGRSPAHQVRATANGGVLPAIPGPLAAPLSIPAERGATVLLPNATLTYYIFDDWPALSEADVVAINSAASSLWVSGRIEYLDSFGDTHVTTYQYRYSPRAKGYSAEGPDNKAT